MEYLTAHYWQQGDVGTSLVLQHLMYRKEGLSMVFACVCTEQENMGEGCFTGQLNEWFRREGRELLRRDRGEVLEQTEQCFCRAFAELEEGWERYLIKQGRTVVPPKLCGIFCVDNRFLLFQKGEIKVYLLNTRFERSSCKALVGEMERMQKISCTCGILEPGLGILLATESFCSNLSGQQLSECLAAKELTTRQRLQKRLKELGEEGARQGAEQQGAVLLVTQ